MFGNLFKSRKPISNIVHLDMHSHLIPDIDDGVDTFDESVEMIREMASIGYSQFITTPHIMGDFYRNSPENILPLLEELKTHLDQANIDVKIAAAAEYYLDEWFVEKVNKQENLLTMGDNFILVETSYINKPNIMEEVLFDLKTLGYKPILAHPERYTYMHHNFDLYRQLYNTGVYFQININSLCGYYSGTARKIAEELIKNNMVHFIGTDLHGKRHLEALKKSMQTKAYARLSSMDLLNNRLAI